MTAEELVTQIYTLIERNSISPQAEVKLFVYRYDEASDYWEKYEIDVEIDTHTSHMNTLILGGEE